MARLGLGAIALLAPLSVIACTAEGTDAPADANESAIIGGIDATSADFDAVGYIVIQSNGTGGACTGTLISPTVVLTAKHCAMPNPNAEGSGTFLDGGKVYFVVGQDPRHPKSVVEAASVEVAPLYVGGYTNHGSDVAVYTLKTPIANVTPLTVAAAPPSAADVGTSFIAIGYGQQGDGNSGTRKMGATRLEAVTGAPLQKAFASADELIAWTQAAQGGSPLGTDWTNYLRAQYNAPLADDYELYVGGPKFEGEVQGCHGDSGGPLLRRENGKLVIHAVVSTAVVPADKCERGGMYATFGAATREMIARAIGDHCGPEAGDSRLVCGLAAEPTSCGPRAASATTPLVQCLATSCCAVASACLGDSGCSTLASCFSDCAAAGGDASTCNQGCYTAHAGSYTKYAAYAACGAKNCAN
jgi:hypothetical protein